MPAPRRAFARSGSEPWIYSRKFDLTFLTLSGVLVFVPYLSYAAMHRMGVSAGTASLIVGLTVTLLVGGPHMYSTYLRTTFEPRFRERRGFLVYLPLLLIPVLVVLGSLYAFILLLTVFFLWASVHVTHQAQYISETYRRRAGQTVRPADRWLDAAVILASLYTVAMYRFVEDRFVLGDSPLLFPSFLKHRAVAIAFTAGAVALLAVYVAKTVREYRRGEISVPWLLFVGTTVALAFVIPFFENLDVAFQGFNTWHSLQYLALTWLILGRQAERGQIGNGVVRRLAGRRRTAVFYGAMVGATLFSGGLYLLLWKVGGFSQERSYYLVVLSFLLIHYFYDHFLFREFRPLEQEAAAQAA
jgi:hypothetical protein